MSGTENEDFYVANRVVQRRDVFILYYKIITSSPHNIITKDTSCYNKSISRLGLSAGQVTQLHYLNGPELILL